MHKEILKDFWQWKEASRPPIIPLICSFAAKLQQISVQDMLTNPTKLANSLQKSQQLLGYDAIVSIFDPTLEAEACGCGISWGDEYEMPHVVSHPLDEGKTVDQLPVSDIEKMGRIPIVLEATKRLQIVMGNRVDIIGAITGPVTLSQHLGGKLFERNLNDDFSEVNAIMRYANTICIRLCRSYCERKVDGILIYDTLISRLNHETLKVVMPFYRTLFNVVDYFNSYLVVVVGLPPKETVEAISNLDSSAIVFSGLTESEDLLQLCAKKGKHIGLTIPASAFLSSTGVFRETLKNLTSKRRSGFFLATEGQVPYSAPMENMHELMDSVR